MLARDSSCIWSLCACSLVSDCCLDSSPLSSSLSIVSAALSGTCEQLPDLGHSNRRHLRDKLVACTRGSRVSCRPGWKAMFELAHDES